MNLQDLGAWELLQKKLTWQQLGEPEGKTILDFGCGNGVTSAHYAERNTVVAVEPDGKTLAENPYENVRQICGDHRSLTEFDDESFDVIFCHNVLEYAEERQEIMREFERLLKPDGMLSVLKHNRAGRVMQMAVLLNNFEHANALLDGGCGVASKYGVIRYYEDGELTRWAPGLKISKVLGMRTFWDLQQNQELHTDKEWQRQMMALESRVADREEYKSIAFFHHVILLKQGRSF